ncbi:MAG: hypothetical protein L3J39_13150 [Verrucomicrobiales bacterium]|nr:hypothetical protein [Verrucomicrobiales bacterium]
MTFKLHYVTVDTVRNFQQSIAFIFALALLIGGGSTGACGIWQMSGIDHDHHQGADTVVLFEKTEFCEQPSLPCNDANKETPDLQFSISSDSHKSFSSPLIAILPEVAIVGASTTDSHFEPLVFYEPARPLPFSRQIIFCRFLI